MKLNVFFVNCFLLFYILVFDVFAIPPPDFFIAFFQSVLQVAGIALAMVVGYVIAFRKFLVKKVGKRNLVVIGVLFIVGVGAFAGYKFIGMKEAERNWQSGIENEISYAMGSAGNINQSSFWKMHYEISESNDEVNASRSVKSVANSISGAEYYKMKTNYDVLVIDLRDDISWERGYVIGSLHYKLADFIDYGWKEINYDDYDYVVFLCYAGTTGALTSDFMNKKGYNNTFFFEKGMNSVDNLYFEYEGTLEPPTKGKKYSFFTDEEFESILDDVVVLDVRPYYKFEKNGIEDSVYFFEEAMTTADIEKVFSEFDKDADYVLLCDSDLTCWVAGVAEMDLERRGFSFKGRYTPSKDLIKVWQTYGMLAEGEYEKHFS